LKIINALRGHDPSEFAMTAAELAFQVKCSERRLFQSGGINGLTRRDPPVVIKLAAKGGYALAGSSPDALQ
jgi:hypothetical protein